ncbi:MAG TPA: hypothetical protein VGO00_19395 [Kofleriaceae bacterium]|nr:hypothetical protein [Kofleriaceae bacterium]
MRLATYVVISIALARLAFAEPAPALVLADPDLELRRAVETALRPWHVSIIDDATPPADAAERASTANARYIVWRDRAELVVYDSRDGRQLRTPVQAGALDPVSAAAAALTVKTMLRLPSLETVEPPSSPSPAGFELDAQLGGGGRFAQGTAGWFSAMIVARPWPALGLGLGVAIDVTSGANVDQASFKGTWDEQAVTALASYRFSIDPIELEPWVGAGAVRSSLSGMEMAMVRDEQEALFAVRGGAWAWWRWDRFRVGGGIAADHVFGTPTYTKLGQARAVVFEVPSFGVVAGAAASVSFAL